MKIFIVALLAVAASAEIAPLLKVAEPIPNQYIIKLKDDVDLDFAINKINSIPFFEALGGLITNKFEGGFRGFSAQLQGKALQLVLSAGIAEFVEEDGIVRASAVGSWGLDRVDQRTGMDNNYSPPRSGSGQTVYVVDTGIRHSHNDYSGRASYHWDYQSSNGGEDCNGHGTHCAGTVGGDTYGVCKGCTLKSIRVLSCFGSGSTTNIVNGVNSIPNNGGVGSMSLGGGASSSTDAVVANAVSRGIVMVVAAGNDNANACNYSPAREPSAITVGSTDNSDTRSSFSNYGSCVDIFAPGSDITSTWHTGNRATNTISGTSMACPHVAGAAALLRAKGVSAGSVPSTIVNDATSNVVSSPGWGSPNEFLYVN